uniref:Uncharacterized protein n=1 Tax=Knipowitschia caucasica TaxID=637954 RepID=A0AAV2IRC7_KNICA
METPAAANGGHNSSSETCQREEVNTPRAPTGQVRDDPGPNAVDTCLQRDRCSRLTTNISIVFTLMAVWRAEKERPAQLHCSPRIMHANPQTEPSTHRLPVPIQRRPVMELPRDPAPITSAPTAVGNKATCEACEDAGR